MEFRENVSLAEYTTMKVGGPARYLACIGNEKELVEALGFAKEKGLSVIVIGEGSNTIFADKGYDGLVIINRIKGIEVSEKEGSFSIRAGSGEKWDDVVKKSVDLSLTGMEALSLIPGSVGAAPVQNIGAYGQDISGVLESVEVYDETRQKFEIISREECGLGYRTSIFKWGHPDYEEGRYIITAVTFRLKRGFLEPPFYKDIEAYLKENNISEYTPANIREAVLQIRTKKLPDPKKAPNSGSFFRNPIVSKEKFTQIEEEEPSINEVPEGWSQPPRWILPDSSVKIAAGWLLEQVGYSAYYDKATGMETWPTQNLTLVNKSAKSAEDVIKFRDVIVNKVKDKFGIELEEEVRVIE
ncbi:MAG: UDP-N-acetylmuramate dehydrogenase [Candidatus Colwellbacteria bacterium CG10_big_fil_rev_8_21_14_0_10_42_22]|uniref:UDP-N-acetylenolpyruvoylglucosamine reductase n=1 Tax=Candidatus Colwellbacteria bacterium CG10_big_fil_rev_8_21_14_0_10_42_22 TaxID=1974540 RepID=A0A2H0VHQ0_9BACT|nr:MAG: UDP-N-acetylmuramate dehydrogenase [Candidatus Colwellbacteria bacterium CG10_big_fil_rev_8_21_14_0_10_42_22]